MQNKKTIFIVIGLVLLCCFIAVCVTFGLMYFGGKAVKDKEDDVINNLEDFQNDLDSLTDEFDDFDNEDVVNFETLDYLTYTDNEYGFELKYPSTWTEATNSLINYAVAFKAPMDDSLDQYQENFNVIIDPSASAYTLDEYVEMSKTSIETMYPTSDININYDTDLGGMEAQTMEYTITQGELGVDIYQVITIKNDSAYIITYGIESNFDEYSNIFNNIVDSFKFISTGNK